MTPQALNGIKVLDLSRVLAAPGCTQILADLGAEVIKIERPGEGDETRQWSPPNFADGTAAYFATVNRNKKSLTVDMAKPEGQALLRQLAAAADIVVENFKVGGLKKYGLDYDSLKQSNPGLIYASLTGFGQTGPDAAKPGYDYIIQGLSGLMSITGPADGLPHKVGVAVVDLFAGLQLTIGIQAALIARAQTGLGQQVDVSLLDSAVAMSANVGMNCLASGSVPPRLGNAHPNIVPYQLFPASDGHLIIACGNDRQFAALCRVLDLAELSQDPDYATNPARVANRDRLVPMLSGATARMCRADLIAALEGAGVPGGPVNDVAEALADPQVAARGLQIAPEGIAGLRSPMQFSRSPLVTERAAPALGEGEWRFSGPGA